ncbi:hypothetical protein IEQ34_004641 [Dendrobium chrysotoxum]|uniref:Uncharacterized protein n=1 Tax=Dendrobium chrysotoxum TaxID=161865 RepID=A0AAV7HIX7_DENCH|nr:hypothetical protein IEQ34_004641 [Dendrobium chrysotoxum]
MCLADVSFPELKASSIHCMPSLWILEEEIITLLIGDVLITLPDPLHILIKLANDMDYSRIIYHRAYLINNCYKKLTKWSPLFNVGVEFSLIALPSVSSCLSVVRVLVELDITKSYPNKVWLGPESFSYIQQVEWRSFPLLCFQKEFWAFDKAMELGPCVGEVCLVVEEEAAPLNTVVHLHSVLALDVSIDVKVKVLDLGPSVAEASFVVEDEAASVGVNFQLNSILPLVVLVIVEAEAIDLPMSTTGDIRDGDNEIDTFGISNSLDWGGGGDVVSSSPVASGYKLDLRGLVDLVLAKKVDEPLIEVLITVISNDALFSHLISKSKDFEYICVTVGFNQHAILCRLLCYNCGGRSTYSRLRWWWGIV